MKTKYFIIAVLGSVCLSFIVSFGYCYEVNVHEKITEKAIKSSSINASLVETGLNSGIEEIINEKAVQIWMREGSIKEDEHFSPLVTARYLNHFYNPLNNSGLADFPFYGMTSSYEWGSNHSYNSWTWKRARDYFYDGLTKSTKSERDQALASSFRAIGQVMHLVQDLASPAHVRNDGHPTGDPYEVYTSATVASLNYSLEPFPYWNVSLSPYAPKQFWDLESYDGSIAYDSGYIGLAEYTAANFYSRDTIGIETAYPHPSRLNTNLTDFSLFPTTVITTPDKITHTVFHVSGYSKQHLAALKYFGQEILELPGSDVLMRYKLSLFLDNECHKEYANFLVPRAVGYSAGLLNYFFRGQIDMVADPVQQDRYIIKNLSFENISGTFSLYYDDNYDTRRQISNWKFSLNANSQSSSITFTLPTDAKEPNKYMLVFKGQMGHEQEAVIGRVFKVPPLIGYFDGSSGSFKEWKQNNQCLSASQEYLSPLSDAQPKLFIQKKFEYRGKKIYLIQHLSQEQDYSTWNSLFLMDYTNKRLIRLISLYNQAWYRIDKPVLYNTDGEHIYSVGIYRENIYYAVHAYQSDQGTVEYIKATTVPVSSNGTTLHYVTQNGKVIYSRPAVYGQAPHLFSFDMWSGVITDLGENGKIEKSRQNPSCDPDTCTGTYSTNWSETTRDILYLTKSNGKSGWEENIMTSEYYTNSTKNIQWTGLPEEEWGRCTHIVFEQDYQAVRERRMTGDKSYLWTERVSLQQSWAPSGGNWTSGYGSQSTSNGGDIPLLLFPYSKNGLWLLGNSSWKKEAWSGNASIFDAQCFCDDGCGFPESYDGQHSVESGVTYFLDSPYQRFELGQSAGVQQMLYLEDAFDQNVTVEGVKYNSDTSHLILYVNGERKDQSFLACTQGSVNNIKFFILFK